MPYTGLFIHLTYFNGKNNFLTTKAYIKYYIKSGIYSLQHWKVLNLSTVG